MWVLRRHRRCGCAGHRQGGIQGMLCSMVYRIRSMVYCPRHRLTCAVPPQPNAAAPGGRGQRRGEELS